MKNVHLIYFVAATIFAIAAVVGILNDYGARSVVSALLSISFLLAGIHYRKKGRKII